jgi:hypothetical protein
MHLVLAKLRALLLYLHLGLELQPGQPKRQLRLELVQDWPPVLLQRQQERQRAGLLSVANSQLAQDFHRANQLPN